LQQVDFSVIKEKIPIAIIGKLADALELLAGVFF